ncbi:hypothetical protein BDA99DRAFT_529129 [Phascolomyces articulosus]|uniref:Uncharacterized protein n=1 Tax=Phascolomyces articulosus TaxID=60185 RepID=A0AAD5JZK6_9FUNG|nr:hypothetical protein BDA99DRAFT_529129 [Phascolomyces articulosus]
MLLLITIIKDTSCCLYRILTFENILYTAFLKKKIKATFISYTCYTLQQYNNI